MSDLPYHVEGHSFTFHVDLSQIHCICGWCATGGEEIIDRHNQAVAFLKALEERKYHNGPSLPIPENFSPLSVTPPVTSSTLLATLLKFFSFSYNKTTN